MKAMIQDTLLALNPSRESVSPAMTFIVGLGIIGLTGLKMASVVSEDDFNTWKSKVVSRLRCDVVNPTDT